MANENGNGYGKVGEYYRKIAEVCREHGDIETAGEFYANSTNPQDRLLGADIFARASDPRLVMRAIDIYMDLREDEYAKASIRKTRGLLQPDLENAPPYPDISRASVSLRSERHKQANEINKRLNELEAALN